MKSKNGNDKNLVFIPLRFLGPVRIAVPVSLHTICENTHTRIRAYNGKIEKRGIEIRFCFFPRRRLIRALRFQPHFSGLSVLAVALLTSSLSLRPKDLVAFAYTLCMPLLFVRAAWCDMILCQPHTHEWVFVLCIRLRGSKTRKSVNTRLFIHIFLNYLALCNIIIWLRNIKFCAVNRFIWGFKFLAKYKNYCTCVFLAFHTIPQTMAMDDVVRLNLIRRTHFFRC